MDNSFDLISTYPLSPFKIKKNILQIPQKYLDVLLSLQDEDSSLDFTNLEATQTNWELTRELLISGYWMDCWYDQSLPTPNSELIPISELQNKFALAWKTGKFVRLNSLSSKTQKEPIFMMNNHILDNLLSNERILSSIDISKRINRELSLVVRDWVDLSQGTEWRCFIYEDKLKAICDNDYAQSLLTNKEIIARVATLLNKVKFNLPCTDCIMDVWLHSHSSNLDQIIEFNSYGFWSNAGSGMFKLVRGWNNSI